GQGGAHGEDARGHVVLEHQEPGGEEGHDQERGDAHEELAREDAPGEVEGGVAHRGSLLVHEPLGEVMSGREVISEVSRSSTRGRHTGKRDPRPSWLSTSMVPPCMPTRRWAMESPSPVPPRRERASPDWR